MTNSLWEVSEEVDAGAADAGSPQWEAADHGLAHARILLVSQFFGPDASAVGQFLFDFALDASAAGHQVQVICGVNDYAQPRHAAGANRPDEALGSRGQAKRLAEAGSIQVKRVRTAAFSQSKAKKLFSYATFCAGAAGKALANPRPDWVITLTAPPGLAWIGWIMQKIRGCRHAVWEMDVYPDIAVALGMRSARWFTGALDFPRRRAHRLLALGDCMKARLLRHGVAAERIRIVENWADGQLIAPRPFPPPLPLQVLYSGNFGRAHDVETIGAVLEHLAGHPAFSFVFAGGGARRKELMEFCRGHGWANVSFRNYARQQDLGASLAGCHIGLVTQKPETLGAVVPSKVYGLMAAGRPILYIGPEKATPAVILERWDCGWQFACGDHQGVSALLERLLHIPEEIFRKGRNGRRAFLENYDRPSGTARICQALGVAAPRVPCGEPAVDCLSPAFTES